MTQAGFGRSPFPKTLQPGIRAIGAVLVFAFALGGCADMPYALNPAEWFKSVEKVFTGDGVEDDADETESRLTAERDQPAPGADRPFPSLATTPERPSPSSRAERQTVVEGLVADRERAQYSSEVIRRQGEPTETLQRTGSAGPPPPPPPPITAPRPSVEVAKAPAAAPPAPAAAPPAPRRPPQTDASSLAAPGGVQETYRARLAQRLPTAEAGAAPPANALALEAFGAFETVVVSSAGVQLGLGARARVQSPLPPSAAAEAGRVAGAAPTAMAGMRKVATIQFANGSAGLSDRAMRVLRQVSRLYGQDDGISVRIVGHASSRTPTMDAVRHAMVNFRISADRAESVAFALEQTGVSRDRMTILARSDSEPLYFEFMPSGESGNRRAEIYFMN
ncbi:MAG: OmpA family protein [Rhodospirillales bacterium]|nr:OmpA family protein [Rhodospirillales bacterium]